METIFNHNSTIKELNDVRFDSLSLCLKFGIDIKEQLTPVIYKNLVSRENSNYDLACLFEFKENKEKANQYWSKLPEAHKTKDLGYDNLGISD